MRRTKMVVGLLIAGVGILLHLAQCSGLFGPLPFWTFAVAVICILVAPIVVGDPHGPGEYGWPPVSESAPRVTDPSRPCRPLPPAHPG